ncbi:MAG: hypothetical protein ABIT76_10510 [Chthoniobacterales bacterium]
MSDWNEACERLEYYLRSYHVSDRERVLQLTLEILAQAKKEHAADPSQTPLQITMKLAMDRTDAWFINLAGTSTAIHHPLGARGRAVWLAIEGHRKWPSAFLSENPPAELLEAVRQQSMEAGPGLEFTSLLRKEIDYGPVEDLARETWEKFSWAHVLGAFLLWTAIFFAAWASWLHLHP